MVVKNLIETEAVLDHPNVKLRNAYTTECDVSEDKLWITRCLETALSRTGIHIYVLCNWDTLQNTNHSKNVFLKKNVYVCNQIQTQNT